MVPMGGILVEQVLVNLLENSVLHGKTTKLIRIVVIHEPGKLLVAVEDDGQGIKPEVLPEMFEGKIHSEEDGEEYDAKRNMGIGLSVCKSIITAHKGGVKAENMSAGRCQSDVLAAYGGGRDRWRLKTESLSLKMIKVSGIL